MFTYCKHDFFVSKPVKKWNKKLGYINHKFTHCDCWIFIRYVECRVASMLNDYNLQKFGTYNQLCDQDW